MVFGHFKHKLEYLLLSFNRTIRDSDTMYKLSIKSFHKNWFFFWIDGSIEYHHLSQRLLSQHNCTFKRRAAIRMKDFGSIISSMNRKCVPSLFHAKIWITHHSLAYFKYYIYSLK